MRVSFAVGTYIDNVDCGIVPMDACHLLLGQPWQYDHNATHEGRSNTYSFVHGGKKQVLKRMADNAIKVEVVTPEKPKCVQVHDILKKIPEITQKMRTSFLQERRDDMVPITPTTSTCASVLNSLVEFVK